MQMKKRGKKGDSEEMERTEGFVVNEDGGVDNLCEIGVETGEEVQEGLVRV